MLCKNLFEFGLAEQQQLEQRMRAELEVRQHAQLFERLDRQVLRFVDHQQAAAARARDFLRRLVFEGMARRYPQAEGKGQRADRSESEAVLLVALL